MPFQQQDVGVGACATAALWTALTKVMRKDGRRPPTPLEVTKSATATGFRSRTSPARDGLTLEQMATAIQHARYSPHLLQRADENDLFLLALKTYLASGIPVVARLHIKATSDYHAITVVGFRERPTLGEGAIAIEVGSRTLRSRGIVRFYVHDDRFGPYARLRYEPNVPGSGDGQLWKLMPTEDGFEDLTDEMTFADALIPLYPKLRLTAEELIDFAVDALPAVGFLVEEEARDALWVAPRFWLGGEYVRNAWSLGLAPDRMTQLATTALLSRYVGVLSFRVKEEWFCDLVYDTTDIRRGELQSSPRILAVVARDPRVAAELAKWAPDAVVV